MNARITRLLSCAAGTVAVLALGTGQALADDTHDLAPLDLQTAVSVVVPSGTEDTGDTEASEDTEASDTSSPGSAEEPEEGNGLSMTEPQQGNGL